ncbi:MAG: tRNA uridine-5-carboxymethylaminomethyl(34) synthesis GTPase MnmE [Clostridia bacterium]
MQNINSISTIAAICTASGVGAIAVIRISGEKAHQIADKIFKGNKKISDLKGYQALFGTVCDINGEHLDECIALNFVAPKSFTGEDMVEISCHGGSFVSKRVLDAVIKAGARPALSGEFTKRAFLNGKMDLAQAESVIEIINATGERARQGALSIKEGRLSKEIGEILTDLVNIGGDLSAWADYPDDDVPQVDEKMLKTKLENAKTVLENMIKNFDSGKIYRDGVKTAILGRPNAGKSTLMNLLSGCERSIVTDIAGTTRDVVEERVMIGQIPLILADTAGLRDTLDPVEKIGVKMAKDRLNWSELILAVFDGSQELNEQDKQLINDIKDKPSIAIINKSDLEQKINCEYIFNEIKYSMYISAIDGKYSTELKKLVEKIFGTLETGGAELCTQRQRDSVNRALISVEEALNAVNFGLTLDAVTVMTEDAVSSLLELTGKKVSDTLVNNVFSRFCVGK